MSCHQDMMLWKYNTLYIYKKNYFLINICVCVCLYIDSKIMCLLQKPEPDRRIQLDIFNDESKENIN